MRIDELQILAGWLANGHKAAMATVITTWGSAPRPVGSMLVVREDGAFEGSVSGGCVEGAVITAALECIEDGKARDLSFGVSNGDAFAIGLTCGGTIRIHVEPAHHDQLTTLVDLRARRQRAVRVLRIGEPDWTLVDETTAMGDVLEALQGERSFLAATDGAETFLHVIAPSPRLLIVGAVHIAQCLSAMADMAGYDVTVIDPRTAFATPERFAQAHLITSWPEKALGDLQLDQGTAVVTLSHDIKLDDPALQAAIVSPAFYIAALGSRKSHGARRQRLAEAGLDNAAVDRIHGPAGLAIGALSPAEIAISIMAQMTALRRGGNTTG